MFTQTKPLALLALALTACLAPSLNAESRTWTLSDGKTTIDAELANALDGMAYFKKADEKFVQLPLTFLAPNEIARVIAWARERDAQPPQQLMASQGQVIKDICKQWPNRFKSGELSDKEVVNERIVPTVIVVVMVRDMIKPYHLPDDLRALRDLDAKLNADGGHFMEVLLLTPFRDAEMSDFKSLIRRNGGDWWMPNEWQMKDNAEIWAGYWRQPVYTILVLDPNGTVLSDSSVKTPDGSKYQNPIEYLEGLVKVRDRMKAGGYSVESPFVNVDAFQKILADLFAQKANTPPRPAFFNFNGMDPKDQEALAGRKFKVSVEIGTDGLARNLKVIEGGDAQADAAFKQASMLWQFLPVCKIGIPEAKTVVIPITLEAPKPAPAPEAAPAAK
jgi:hypothetical protein